MYPSWKKQRAYYRTRAGSDRRRLGNEISSDMNRAPAAHRRNWSYRVQDEAKINERETNGRPGERIKIEN